MTHIPKTPGNPDAPVTIKDLSLQGSSKPGEATKATKYTDAAAVAITTQDARTFAQWIQDKQWGLRWTEADVLYQSPRMVTAWEGQPESRRANVSDYMLLEHVNAIHPTCVKALFYQYPPFEILAYPGVDSDIVRATKALIAIVLKRIGFKQEMKQALLSDILSGTVILKRGWTCTNVIRKKRVRKAPPLKVQMPAGDEEVVATRDSQEFEIVEETVNEQWPFIEKCNISHIYVDPKHKDPDIRKAKAVIDERYVYFDDLDAMRQEIKPDGTQVYKIPSRETLLSFFETPADSPKTPAAGTTVDPDGSAVHHAAPRWKKTSADPLLTPIKLVERWSKDAVFVVLNDDLCIRNDENEFREPPYYSANWFDIPDAFYGIGTGRTVGQRQRVKQGATNGALDVLSMELNTPFLVARAANVPTQDIRARLGGLVVVDGEPSKAFSKPPMPEVPTEIWAMLQANAASAEASSGADSTLVQGQMSQRGRGGAMRTPAGARAVIGANASKLEGPLDRFIEMVFVPFIEDVHEMCLDWMPENQIIALIGKMLGKEAGSSVDMDEFLNTEFEFEALAGAYIAAQKAMALSVPLMIQLLENGTFVNNLNDIGWTVDMLKLAKLIADGTESKNFKEIFRKMTEDEIKKRQAQQQAGPMAAVQGKLAVDKQRSDSKKEEIAEEHQAQLAQNIIENSLARASGSELRQEFKGQI